MILEPIKFRVLNEFGGAEFLGSADDIEVHLPYENGSLVKRMRFGAVKITDEFRGEAEFTISNFEVQGLKVGDDQNFVVRIVKGTKQRDAIFHKALSVRTMDLEGQQRKVIVKK